MSLTLVYDQSEDVMRWIATRIPGFTSERDAYGLGIERNGGLIAGVAFENFNGVHCEVSFATERPGVWASKRVLRGLFEYAFHHIGCVAISVSVPSSNPQSLALCTKVGFSPEALVRFAAHDGSTLVILKMFKETCPWIEDRDHEAEGSTQSPGS